MASFSTLGLLIGLSAAVLFILATVFATASVAVVAQRHNYRGDTKLPLWLQSMLCCAAATLSSGIIGFIASMRASFTLKKQTFIAAGIIGCVAGVTAIIAVVLWSLRGQSVLFDGKYDFYQTHTAVLSCIIIALICSVGASVLAFLGLLFGGSKELYPEPQLGYYHRRSSGDFYVATVPGAT